MPQKSRPLEKAQLLSLSSPLALALGSGSRKSTELWHAARLVWQAPKVKVMLWLSPPQYVNSVFDEEDCTVELFIVYY